MGNEKNQNDDYLKRKLKRFVEVKGEKIIDLETLKSWWHCWGNRYTEKISVENGCLLQHTWKKEKKPYETREHGATYIVYGYPRTKNLGKITATGDTKDNMEVIKCLNMN